MECIIKGKVLIVPEGITAVGFLDIISYFPNHEIDEIILPSTLEVIEHDAFYDLSGIKKINLPNSVKEIGDRAFWGMTDLEELIVSDTIKRVGKHAFCNCNKLLLIILGDSLAVPRSWDSDFAPNIREICFVKNI